MMARGVALLLLLVISFGVFGSINGQVQPSLRTNYYNTTCPSVQSIVDQVVNQTVSQNRDIAGGLLRLHFHDCFVRGCDASVLIDSTPSHQAEKDGTGNVNSLRGFEVIDSVKRALETACPGVVSCADVVAMVARSAVSMVGGPTWVLPLGRRDGNVSNGNETGANLPPPSFNYRKLVDAFAGKGLDEHDMVVLSGAHTIGDTHCGIIEDRLYNFSSGAVHVDPTLNLTFATRLIELCPFSKGKSTTVIPMDFKGNDNFDDNYFVAVRANRGIFRSDAFLLTNTTGAQIVARESSGNAQFFTDFALAMTKMGKIEVKLAPDGDVRLNCSVFNPPALAPPPSPTVASPRTPGPAPAPVSAAGDSTLGRALAPGSSASAPIPRPTPAPVPGG